MQDEVDARRADVNKQWASLHYSAQSSRCRIDGWSDTG